TAGATVLYGFLVAWAWPRCRPGPSRVALVVLSAAMVTLVAASRVVLGMHYPSDCAAAVVEGLLWVAICRAGTSPLAQPSPDEQALVR
ncbi:MAG TPA: phosphatase PAP2 family protein, partial [Albitalea sp.]|nr:phosphatase PAP2 family protein [Albitalea sp.]